MQTHETIREIKLQGWPLRLKTDRSEKTLELLKREVEGKIRLAQESHSHIPLEKALLLTCLQLAEDKFLLKKAAIQDLDRLESQARGILADLESPSDGAELEEAT